MKRKYFLYTAAIALIVSVAACNKALDIKPTGSIDQSQAILTAKDVQSTLVGTYNRMAQSDLYAGDIFMYSDLMATQTIVNWTGTFQELTQMVNQKIIVDNGFVQDTWLRGYQTINLANNVLANLNKVVADDKDRTEGEAKFIRGLMYFDLARLYGKAYNDGTPSSNLAVPIVLTPTTVVSDASYVSRATVKAVYDQAISDLTDAEAKLPETNSFRATKGAAQAILARLYLQQGNYTLAVTEANNVISSGDYSLNATYAAEFPNGTSAAHFDNTSEDIFAIQVTSQQGVNSFNTYFASSGFGGRGDVRAKTTFVADSFATNDSRGKFFTATTDDDGNPLYYRTKKYNNSLGNAHVVRLAEMYLIRAEGNFRNGTAIGATPTADVNKIRVRAGATPIGTVKLGDIIRERILELHFEGFALQDVKRLGGKANNTSFNSPSLVFPVPQRELLANKNLVQNEGY
jgi:tetratricopeptide (TPR) repeat protein